MRSAHIPPRRKLNVDALTAGMESMIGYVLLGGVLLSIALIAGGLVWRWVVNGDLSFTHFARGENLLRFFAATILLGKRPSMLVNMGIVALMLTPYIRVLGSAFYFALVEHNRKYTAFTVFVLSVLTYTLFIR